MNIKIVSSVLASSVAAGGVFYAGAKVTSPDLAGVIHACYDTGSGQVRLVDADSHPCHAGERPIDWSQRGPAGPAGARGPQGEVGPQGPAGPAAGPPPPRVIGRASFDDAAPMPLYGLSLAAHRVVAQPAGAGADREGSAPTFDEVDVVVEDGPGLAGLGLDSLRHDTGRLGPAAPVTVDVSLGDGASAVSLAGATVVRFSMSARAAAGQPSLVTIGLAASAIDVRTGAAEVSFDLTSPDQLATSCESPSEWTFVDIAAFPTAGLAPAAIPISTFSLGASRSTLGADPAGRPQTSVAISPVVVRAPLSARSACLFGEAVAGKPTPTTIRLLGSKGGVESTYALEDVVVTSFAVTGGPDGVEMSVALDPIAVTVTR